MLAASCSSDNDDLGVGTGTGELRDVVFNVKSDAFKVEVSPLAKFTKDINYDPQYYGQYFAQCIIYDEAGAVVSNKIVGSNDKDVLFNDGQLTMGETLEEGNYHVSIVSGVCGNPMIPTYYYIKPEDYFTDYYYPSSSPSSAVYNNRSNYYETFDLTVGAVNEPISVVLNPMWSKLTFEIENHQALDIPEGTDLVYIFMNPILRGYSIKDKVARGTVHETPLPSTGGTLYEGRISRFLETEKLKTSLLIAASDQPTTIYIQYIKFNINGSFIYLGTQEIVTVRPTEMNKKYYVMVE